jgi:DNA helicase II / ATP-dependent DNA helicase PcrA
VFLVGLSDGLLPTSQAQTDAAVAEERRLLYVGVTRAREHLQLSYSRARHPRARASRNVSRFLTDLWPGERRAVKVAPAAPEPDQGVVDALTRWRDLRAAELRRQPGSLLTTATIRAIAARRPATLEELGQVRGVGPRMLADLGEQLLEALRAPVR